MRYLRWFLLPLLLLGLTAGVVQARDCTFTWDPVTTDTHGDPVTVDGYRLYRSMTSGQYGDVMPIETNAPPITVTCAPGEFWVVTAYMGGTESIESNEFRVASGQPHAPTNFRLEAQ